MLSGRQWRLHQAERSLAPVHKKHKVNLNLEDPAVIVHFAVIVHLYFPLFMVCSAENRPAWVQEENKRLLMERAI
jgi:hypothetical protein